MSCENLGAFKACGTGIITMIFSEFSDPKDVVSFGKACKKLNEIKNKFINSNNYFFEAMRAYSLRSTMLKWRNPENNFKGDCAHIYKEIQDEISDSYLRRDKAISCFNRYNHKYATQWQALGLKEVKSPVLISYFLREYQFFADKDFPNPCFVEGKASYEECKFALERVTEGSHLKNAFCNEPDLQKWTEQQFNERCNYLDTLFKHLFKKGRDQYFAFLKK